MDKADNNKFDLILEKIELNGFDSTFLTLIVFFASLIIGFALNKELLISFISNSELKALGIIFLAYIAVSILGILSLRIFDLFNSSETYKSIKLGYKLTQFSILTIFIIFLYVIGASLLDFYILNGLSNIIGNIIVVMFIGIICWIMIDKKVEASFAKKFPQHQKKKN